MPVFTYLYFRQLQKLFILSTFELEIFYSLLYITTASETVWINSMLETDCSLLRQLLQSKELTESRWRKFYLSAALISFALMSVGGKKRDMIPKQLIKRLLSLNEKLFNPETENTGMSKQHVGGMENLKCDNGLPKKFLLQLTQ